MPKQYRTSRNRLHVNKLGDFKSWAIAQGWQEVPPKSFYEKLRLTKGGKIAIIHGRDTNLAGRELVHLTAHGESETLVSQWLKHKRDHPPRSPEELQDRMPK